MNAIRLHQFPFVSHGFEQEGHQPGYFTRSLANTYNPLIERDILRILAGNEMLPDPR
jgi:hypothetical protein